MDGDEAIGDAAASPADRLRARAEATDRDARFAERLAAVEAARARRHRRRGALRVLWIVVLAGVGALVPLVVAAVVNGPDPTGGTLLLAAVAGAVVGGVGPVVRDALARRRGAAAWDAYHERYVLLGNPSAAVHDADRPRPQRGGPPLPPDRG